MQPDNEFESIFQAKLGQLEAEPSPESWNIIKAQITVPQVPAKYIYPKYFFGLFTFLLTLMPIVGVVEDLGSSYQPETSLAQENALSLEKKPANGIENNIKTKQSHQVFHDDKQQKPISLKNQTSAISIIANNNSDAPLGELTLSENYIHAELDKITGLIGQFPGNKYMPAIAFDPLKKEGLDQQIDEVVQNIPEANEKLITRWSKTVYISPRYNFNNKATYNKDDEVKVLDVISSKVNGRERFGLEAGINLSYIAAKNLRVNLGLSLVNLQEKTQILISNGDKNSLSVVDDPHNNDNNNNNMAYNLRPVLATDTISYQSNYWYTGLNIGMQKNFFKVGKTTLYLNMGTAVNVLVYGKTSVENNNLQTGNFNSPNSGSPLEQLNFKLIGGPGISKKLSSKKELIFEPLIHYYLGSTYKSREPIGIKPYSVGLNLGVRF